MRTDVNNQWFFPKEIYDMKCLQTCTLENIGKYHHEIMGQHYEDNFINFSKLILENSAHKLEIII